MVGLNPSATTAVACAERSPTDSSGEAKATATVGADGLDHATRSRLLHHAVRC